MAERVIMSGDAASSVAAAQDPDGAYRLLFVLGLGMAVVGFADVALLYYPARWASIDWEFGTVIATFDGLPLGTMGLGFAAVACVAQGWTILGRVLAGFMLLMTVLLVVLLLVFVLDVPVALRAADAVMKPTLKKAIVKTGSMALVYILVYGTLGVVSFRRLRASAKGV